MRTPTQNDLGRAIIAIADQILSLEDEDSGDTDARRAQYLECALYNLAYTLWPSVFAVPEGFILTERRILTSACIYVFHISSVDEDSYIDIEVETVPRDDMFALLSDTIRSQIAHDYVAEHGMVFSSF